MSTISVNAEKQVRLLIEAAAEQVPDAKSAVAVVLAKLDQSPELKAAWMEEAIEVAVAATINMRRARARDHFKQASMRMDLGVVSEATNAVCAGMLDGWLVGSKRLGDCTAADLAVASEKERISAAGHLTNAKFYESLAVQVPSGPVRAVLDDQAVARVFKAATA